ncbi:MAG: chloride channel protein, partial [Xanthomonadaceae bacterium]|nr:chloride channel protein [Xanthomonadaceae bacterium]
REGPAVHLGAAAGSLLGQRAGLDGRDLRTLVGCGVAAAIAATFNTPLAGVVFAMEVVLMEYSLAGFLPVIVAAVAGAAVGQLAFGDALSLPVGTLPAAGVRELPAVVAAGVVLGTLAATFSGLLLRIAGTTRPWPWPARLFAGGLATAAAGLVMPEVMGLGYDTIARAVAGDYGAGPLLAIAVLKLLATAAAIGCGLPGGLIGPTLVMGAAAGGVLGMAGAVLAPALVPAPGLCALLGAGAMMGATLQAPLAALTALFEMTGNPHVVLPGMLAIVTACLVSRELHGRDSIFHAQMRAAGLRYHAPGLAH